MGTSPFDSMLAATTALVTSGCASIRSKVGRTAGAGAVSSFSQATIASDSKATIHKKYFFITNFLYL